MCRPALLYGRACATVLDLALLNTLLALVLLVLIEAEGRHADAACVHASSFHLTLTAPAEARCCSAAL